MGCLILGTVIRIACRLDNTEIQHDVSHEGQQLPRNDSEAIVVEAVGSAAPWLLTGWAEGTEVLATLVFDRMCVSDPRMCSRLRPCGRRLVSADSSPLMVRGELDITVAFPGLSCAMVLVVVVLDLKDYWGRRPCSRVYLTNSIYGRADGHLTLQLHQQRLAAHASAHLTSIRSSNNFVGSASG